MNIAVILSGGKGLRFGGNVPKQILPLGFKPLISWSVDTFHKMDLIDKIIIVSEKTLINNIKLMFPETKYPKILFIIEGGDKRSDSSYKAIISSEFNDNDVILFHDAARPFVTEEIIKELLDNIYITGACGTYINTTDTIAIVRDSKIETIPERSSVYSAQTPQVFRYDLIKKAHELYNQNPKINITDDVSLLVQMGISVIVVKGSHKNIKITTDLDLKFAEYLISGDHI